MEAAVSISGISPGLPVEIGRIDRELGRLWEESGDTKSRASLINLAIYTESADAVPENTELIRQIAREHACRAILVFARPDIPEESARAWISAHCHIVGKGDRQICSEQITFELTGDTTASLPNIVFSHLDSDLPLCFWWQGHFHNLADAKLWSWVDRLIYDSRCWDNPSLQFGRVADIHATAEQRIILCDLNWTRLLSARFAIAQFFDHTAALPHLSRLRKVEIVHAPGFETTGLLLLGWLAAQLGWKAQETFGSHSFRAADGSEVTYVLRAGGDAAVSLCRLESEDASFELKREGGGELFHASMQLPGSGEFATTLAAGRDQMLDILLMELGRGGKHPLYLKAIRAIAPLLENRS